MKRVAILGSTGSVGVNALSLLADRADMFAVVATVARSRERELLDQVRVHRPDAVCLVAGGERPAGVPESVAWFTGAEGVLEALAASKPDLVLNAITGAAGLPASEWAAARGIPLALANKESLVMAGSYLTDLARESGAAILPVDSEHCAIFQCLHGEDPGKVRRIYLTASGGPFRTRPAQGFASISPEEALRHPTWDMGPRITIGSATMMNKAFEVLEAHWLFGLEPEQIQVLVHPQSIIHSMVEFVDGSMLAQMGKPDMRVPILYCLGYPERLPLAFEPFDPMAFRELTMEAVDPERFPAVPLAYQTLQRGGDSGAVLNAADEVMTELFLSGKVSFPAVTGTVARVVQSHQPSEIRSLEHVLAADQKGRSEALALVERPSNL